MMVILKFITRNNLSTCNFCSNKMSDMDLRDDEGWDDDGGWDDDDDGSSGRGKRLKGSCVDESESSFGLRTLTFS